MTERPILFSAPMVRALLVGQKTQTRRVAKINDVAYGKPVRWVSVAPCTTGLQEVACPYGKTGDRLWVRETWAPNEGTAGGFLYRADHGDAASFHQVNLKTSEWTHACNKWHPSIHMPRAASRITLEIAYVSVQRLQQISRGDAMDEGCPFPNMAAGPDPRQWYADLWTEINGPGSWDKDPWVWCLAFKRVS